MYGLKIAFAFLLLNLKRSSGQYDACYTPDGQPGICIQYTNCDLIVSLLVQNSQKPDQNIQNYVLLSICGNRETSQLVCCPGIRFLPLTTTASSSFFFSNTPPPVTTSANINTPAPTTPSLGQYKLLTNAADRCGMSNASHVRVVGGVDAQLGAWPWMAALGYRSSSYDPTGGPKFLCGGTLITARHVLTAAHCIQPQLYFVRLGEYDINSSNDGANPVDIYTEKTFVHEQYNEKTIQNDIALVRLQQNAPLSDMIKPICLPLDESIRTRDLTYYSPFVAGWGTTSFRGPTANRLQEVQVIVLPIDQCAFNYKLYFPDQVFDNTVLCAGFPEGGRDSCQGDSGGPLMLPQLSYNGQYYYYNLIGIISYGYECAKAGFPGVYVKVGPYIPWIEAKLNL
ncbi:venom protease-like [Uranotaenia lowii]|uniref:venom protease-like n=1 Tax=Uranotaenia lowii TaxID=190385 RepID=UPI002479A053|nr:venom protease-like [Uranotaenia lowii]